MNYTCRRPRRLSTKKGCSARWMHVFHEITKKTSRKEENAIYPHYLNCAHEGDVLETWSRH